jgi:hypothetical protein
VATFALASSSTTTTAPKSARTVARASLPRTSRSNERNSGRNAPPVLNLTGATRGISVLSSWRATSAVTPARRRTIASSSLAAAFAKVSLAAVAAADSTVTHASVPRG